MTKTTRECLAPGSCQAYQIPMLIPGSTAGCGYVVTGQRWHRGRRRVLWVVANYRGGFTEVCRYCRLEERRRIRGEQVLVWDRRDDDTVPSWPHEPSAQRSPCANAQRSHEADQSESKLVRRSGWCRRPAKYRRQISVAFVSGFRRSADSRPARDSLRWASIGRERIRGRRKIGRKSQPQPLQRPTVSRRSVAGFSWCIQIGVVNVRFHELGVRPDIVAGASIGLIGRGSRRRSWVGQARESDGHNAPQRSRR